MGKDSSKPKGAMTAYACFVQVIREEHKKKHPNESVVFTEFSKKCAEKWKTMNAKEKKRFEDMAARDKERYGREMKSYVPVDGDKSGRKRKKQKDPNAPKRPLSAFFVFCDEERPKVRAANPEWRVGDVAKELGKRWETCPNKKKFEDKAAKDRQRYETEMAAYKSGSFKGAKRAKANEDAGNDDGDDDDEEEDEDEEDDE